MQYTFERRNGKLCLVHWFDGVVEIVESVRVGFELFEVFTILEKQNETDSVS